MHRGLVVGQGAVGRASAVAARNAVVRSKVMLVRPCKKMV